MASNVSSVIRMGAKEARNTKGSWTKKKLAAQVRHDRGKGFKLSVRRRAGETGLGFPLLTDMHWFLKVQLTALWNFAKTLLSLTRPPAILV